MHALLDVAELMLTEHMDSKELDKFQFKLYRPSLTSTARPRGFEPERQAESFAGLEAMLGGE